MTAPKPFFATAGRNVAHDRPALIDVARWYYDQRLQLAADTGILRRLIEAVNWTNDLSPAQWAQWYSVALGFRPNLILELGRGRGNSTALFGQAAATLGNMTVISLCNSNDWAMITAPNVAKVVGRTWFDALDARVTDILAADYRSILGDHHRVLLLWDAHGFEIAELVLGEILPRLIDREHLVIMHDIVDNRYAGVKRSYDGEPLWKGSAWQERTGRWRANVNIGWMHSIQDQVVAIADFTARNDLELGSADHEYSSFFTEQRADEMRQVLGEEFFSTLGHWAFFSLAGKIGPFHFPAVAGRRAFAHQGTVAGNELPALPATVVTTGRPWDYASAWRWRPAADIPARADAWLRLRLQIDGGSIGVGLMDSNGRDFAVRRALSAQPAPFEVLLPVHDVSQPGALIIQNWATPTTARVRIDELSVVW